MHGAKSWLGGLLAVWAMGAWGQTSQDRGAADTAGPGAGRTQPGGAAPGTPAPGRRQTATRSACAELVRSEARGGPASGSELERACAALIRADARRVKRQRLAAGMGVAAPRPGTEARAAFTPGGSMSGIGSAPRPPMGGQSTTSSENLLSSDLLGAVTGDGINAEYSRAYEDRLSLVGRIRYSRTNASGRAATNIGIGAGFDYFLLGGENQGLRVGPRLEGSFGSLSTVGETNGYGRLALLGEVGYNLVSNGGLTGVLAAGFDLRVAGEQGTDVGFNASGNFSPYVRLGVGWAW